jgi:hypothetical protein
MMTLLAFSALVGLAYFVWNSTAGTTEHLSEDDPLSAWPQQSRLR